MIARVPIRAVSLSLAAAALLAACTAQGEAVRLELTAQDIRWQPSALTVRAGQRVALTVTNDGALPHNFSLDEARVDLDVAPGATETVTFVAPAAGEYTFYCGQPGHREAGMSGTLTVNP